MSAAEESVTVQDESTNAAEQDDPKPELSAAEIEKQEEAKLKAKFPMPQRPMSGQSAFLQKRLMHRQKYFDSGDYQMAKQKPGAKASELQPGLECAPTGDAIPTPETVPARKTSITQSTKFLPSSTS